MRRARHIRAAWLRPNKDRRAVALAARRAGGKGVSEDKVLLEALVVAARDAGAEILKLVAEGHTSKEIARLLVISTKTVERHRANILQKLGLRDRLELTRYAIRVGLIEP